MTPAKSGEVTAPVVNPWNALWAMMIGFFMILVDSTIVAVANPTIMTELHTDWDGVIWVTSAYLLAYAVPLLVAGRLGDRFGPKNLYLVGLFIFTAASLWCGLSGSVETLIVARVVQGIGAALLTPQTLSTITRIFPAERRGVAMSVWGATAGIATLAGPLAGGVLVDHLGWQWIFFVNVPIGIVGLGLAAWLIPTLPTQRHRFDVLGVVLSGVAMFLIVFGLQEGESHGWAGWIWATIAVGVVVLGLFVYWQAVNKNEPLIPLRLFRDRNFSLSNVGVAVIGFTVTAMIVPVMFYAQAVCGMTPTESALLIAPMAVASGLLAPVVGLIIDRAHPAPVIGFGFAVLAIALTWLSVEMTPDTPVWRLVLPFTVMGIGMAFIWSPLAATATRSLPADLAGAGSGVYNATRQVGAVLGSAGIAAFMTSRIGAEMPGAQAGPPEGVVTRLPEFLRIPFAAALSQSMLLPAFVALFGVVTAMFLVAVILPRRQPVRTLPLSGAEQRTEVIPAVDDRGYEAAFDDDVWRGPAERRESHPRLDFSHDLDDDRFDDERFDDDEYVEFAADVRDGPDFEDFEDTEDLGDDIAADDSTTEPLPIRVDHPRPGPADIWHSAPVSSWHSLLDEDHGTEPEPEAELEPEPARQSELIGFAHNGFHVDDESSLRELPDPEPIGFAHNGFHADSAADEPRFVPLPPARPADSYADAFRELAEDIDSLSDDFAAFLDEYSGRQPRSPIDLPEYTPPPMIDDPPSRHRQNEAPPAEGNHPRRPRHYRDDPDDSESYGRHSRH